MLWKWTKTRGKNGFKTFNSPRSLAASVAIGVIELQAVVVEQGVVQRWAGGGARGVCGGLAVRRAREARAGRAADGGAGAAHGATVQAQER